MVDRLTYNLGVYCGWRGTRQTLWYDQKLHALGQASRRELVKAGEKRGFWKGWLRKIGHDEGRNLRKGERKREMCADLEFTQVW